MELRFPTPLAPGDRIGVTSPSSGVGPAARPRIEFAIGWLRDRGYDVVVGECMSADRWVSAPKAERAAELTSMLLDPSIHGVVPPWGGAGTALDLLDLLDYEAIASAEPTWVVGYSDSASWMVPLTLSAGLPTLHGDNLADTPYAAPGGLTHWTEFAAAPGRVAQSDSGIVATWRRFEEEPRATEWRRTGEGRWHLHGSERLDVSGRLIGGCTEMMGGIAGTQYGDVRAFGDEHGDLVVYLEACEDDAFTICRIVHHLRYAGWFEHAVAVLVGSTEAPPGTDDGGLSQRDAVLDGLAGLDVPVVFDMEIGHVPPHLPLLNGATARVVVDADRHEIVQTWGNQDVAARR